MSNDSKNVAVACPNCKNKSKMKLAIRLDDDRLHCWICSMGGRLINLLIKYHKKHVHEYVTKFGNIKYIIDDDDRENVVTVPAGYVFLAHEIKSNDSNIKKALQYLFSRGLTERDLWYFKFGLSSEEEMQKRIIMPSFDNDGNINFYTGRSYEQYAYRKYMNCTADKKAVIFNELHIDWKKELTLVEGPFDLTKCDDNATCLLGSSLNEEFKLFQQIYLNKTPVVLALDNDMVEKSWQNIARMLSSYDIRVKILELGKFKDVGEMTKEQFLTAKSSAKCWNRVDALKMKIRSLNA